MATGTIKRIVADRGFGFIAAEDEKEYFFHRGGRVRRRGEPEGSARQSRPRRLRDRPAPVLVTGAASTEPLTAPAAPPPASLHEEPA
jgi:hypothetical protein